MKTLGSTRLICKRVSGLAWLVCCRRNSAIAVAAACFALILVPSGLRGATSGDPAAVPSLNSLAPTAAPPGGPGFSLDLIGSGFLSTSVVNWNGSARTTTFVDADHLSAAVTAADIATAGTAVVTVTTPGPGGGTSNAQFFQIMSPWTATNFSTFSNREIAGYSTTESNTLVGDFNSDGKLDMVTYSNGTIYFSPGNGDGTFGSSTTSAGPPPPASEPYIYLATADFNGDGKPDLLLTSSNGTFFALGNGNGTFRLLSASLTDDLTLGVAIADFNGDGFLDLAYVTIPSGGPTAIQVQLGNGDGTFHAGPVMSWPGAYNVLAAGDFNGDGKPDIIVSATVGECIAGVYGLLEFSGNGDGTFSTTPYQVPNVTTCGGAGGTMVAADFNGDGKLDIAYFTSLPNVFLPDPGFLSVSLGKGDGTFDPAPFQVIDSSSSSTTSIGPLLAADVNGDGKIDLLTGNRLFLGNGDGSFTPQSPPQNNGLRVVQVGDFNGDGKPDLLALGSNYNGSQFDLRVLLQIPASPDFVGSLSPTTTQVVIAGNSVKYNGTITGLNGFTGDVALTASNLPTGITANFNPSTVTGGSGTYTLTLTAAATASVGTFTITVTGTSGSLSHSSTVTLIVNSTPGDFSGSIASGSSSTQAIDRGQTATYVFQITPKGGFNGNVSLSVSGVPAAAMATLSPTTITGGSGTSTLTVTTTSFTRFNVYTLTVTATSGPLVHTGNVILGVGNGGDFTGVITPGPSTNPSFQSVAPGQTTTYNVAVSYLNGFNPGLGNSNALVFSVSGLPPGATFAETASTITSTSENDTLTIFAPPGTPPGTYTLSITGNGGGRIHTGTTTLVVN